MLARHGLRVRFLARMLGMPARSVYQWMKALQQNQWFPPQQSSLHQYQRSRKAPPSAQDSAHGGPSSTAKRGEDEGHKVLKKLVTWALSSSFENRSGLEFERDMVRMREMFPNELGQQLHSRFFYRECIHAAAQCLLHMDGMDINRPLSSLGIPSDFACCMDPVTIGGMRSHQDTVLVVCLSGISHRTHKIYTVFAAGPSLPMQGHSGEQLSELLLKALGSHPAGLNMQQLRSRLACIVGDGAVCQGGPSHRHSSSAALEKTFRKATDRKQMAKVPFSIIIRKNHRHSDSWRFNRKNVMIV